MKMIFKVARWVPMIICVCANVSERKLRAVIADGASTLREIERRCGAGGGCGACRDAIRQCLRESRAAAAAAAPVVALVAADAPELAPA